MTYSDAARDYVFNGEGRARCCELTDAVRRTKGLCGEIKIADQALSEAFDAGAAHERATHTCPAEPERLTDPDDPRIRDGSLLAFETGENDGTHTTYRKRVGNGMATGTVEWHRQAIKDGCHIYLLAEAPEPEPDVDAVAALAATWIGSEVNARDILASLRAAGLDIVRAAR